MNRMQALVEAGQSIWLDFIDRQLLTSGELGALIAEGVRGVTSNPAIFQAAISGGEAYQTDLRRLASQGLNAKSIFEQLAISDIQTAADLLRPIYEAAAGADGFVSLEVAPDLAYETEATIEEARRLHAAVNRPNLMIKVPATAAGISAIRTLIAGGVNVNVTLIFGLQRYGEVKEAFLRGLEDRVAQGLPIDRVASVASFFVSRVDGLVDGRLGKLADAAPDGADELRALQGKIAVANAKLAYRQFQHKFAGARWEQLAARGAQFQRPLWASTSVKNPSYPELLYVDNLIGPHTVNTMPPATLAAFRQRGVVQRTVDQEADHAEEQVARLEALGIPMAWVSDALEADGVQKFADAFGALLSAIEAQRSAVGVAD